MIFFFKKTLSLLKPWGKLLERDMKLSHLCIILQGEGKYLFQKGQVLIYIYIQKYIPKHFKWLKKKEIYPKVKYVFLFDSCL